MCHILDEAVRRDDVFLLQTELLEQLVIAVEYACHLFAQRIHLGIHMPGEIRHAIVLHHAAAAGNIIALNREAVIRRDDETQLHQDVIPHGRMLNRQPRDRHARRRILRVNPLEVDVGEFVLIIGVLHEARRIEDIALFQAKLLEQLVIALEDALCLLFERLILRRGMTGEECQILREGHARIAALRYIQMLNSHDFLPSFHITQGSSSLDPFRD